MKRLALVTCLLTLAAPHALAAHGPLDSLTVLTSLSLPALALDPVSGDRHVAYLSGGILVHGWESGMGWQTEEIVDGASLTTYTGFQLRIASDGHPVAAYVRAGTLVCAIRGAGGWERDTLDTLTGSTYPIALALDPTSDEPAVAWARYSTVPETPAQVRYARRDGGVWTTALVDTATSSFIPVALGIDGASRPHLAWSRLRQDRTAYVLMHARGEAPDGPFVAAPVDSQLRWFLAIAVDPTNDEPRLVYEATAPGVQIRYAYRTAGGGWESVYVASGFPSGVPAAPGLALDSVGNPIITYTHYTYVEPGLGAPADADAAAACGHVDNGEVFVHYRVGGAGSAPFHFENLSSSQWDAYSGLAAVASVAPGEAVIAWRSPRLSCSPYALTSTRLTMASTTGVGDLLGPGARLAIQPNPARSGDGLRVEFRLPRNASVALMLHDLAGRRVATTTFDGLEAGPHALDWRPPGVNPGLYWLALTAGGERIGSKPVVVLR